LATRIVLFADDLTGALDSGVPFAMRGSSVRVAIGRAGIAEAIASDPDALIVDTDSRALSPDDAASRIEAAWQMLIPFAPQIVMKKVDSRLKGEIAAETLALMRAAGRWRTMICPAVPEQGRHVVAGCVQGPGIATPIPVAGPFASLTGCEIRDAATADDLRSIAAAIVADAGQYLAVGARGLAAALAAEIGGAERVRHPLPRLPLIVAVGSRDPITIRQVERLLSEFPHLADDRAGNIMLIRATDDDDDPATVARHLGASVVTKARDVGARTILATGGDTAAAIVRAMSGAVLTPLAELAPGVPIARVHGVTDIELITKSGGFGDNATLALIARQALAASRSVAA
jgi:D-threonate/D-erythronate kinase